MKDFLEVVGFFGMIFGGIYLAGVLDKLTSKIPSEIFMNGLVIVMIVGIIIAIKKTFARN